MMVGKTISNIFWFLLAGYMMWFYFSSYFYKLSLFILSDHSVSWAE